MGACHEDGVHSSSECFYPSPSPLARELFFYITRYGHYFCDSRYYLSDASAIAQLDGHRNYFILFVKKGRLNIENNGKYFHAVTGQVGLVNCRLPHAYYAQEPLEYYWLHFDGILAKQFFDKIVAVHGGHQVFYPASSDHIEQEYHQLLLRLRQDTLSEVDVTQSIYRILCHLLCGFSADISASPNDAALAAVQFINENFSKNLSVEDVAAAVNLSYSYFSRQFKAFSGHSIHDYITIRRISEAKHLLSTTDLPLKRIASASGYRSESSFIVSFQAREGCTPTEYRRRFTSRRQ